MLIGKLQIILFISIFSTIAFAGQNIINKPNSYEEACYLSYGLIQKNPEEALNVIKYIYRKDLPVRESDIFYVKSIATLALSPIYRENEIGKRLLEKVVAIKRDDFISNRILIAFTARENNIEKTKKYAYNLLSADYNSYIEMMEPASESSSLPMIKYYIDDVIDSYQNIYYFFIKNGDKINAKKAMDIVENIKSIKKQKALSGK